MVPDPLGLWAVTLALATAGGFNKCNFNINRQLGIKRMGKMVKKASLFLNHLVLERKHVISTHILLAITSQGVGGGWRRRRRDAVHGWAAASAVGPSSLAQDCQGRGHIFNVERQ